jgi:two-component system sensor histidine kinase VicK
VVADRKLAEIVLRQLLGNALLYSPPGSPIEVTVSRKGEFIAMGVVNDGLGISPPEQERLFEKFYRGENVRGRVAGSGLGLSIAREIAVAHGGSIWLDNESRRRVRFWFTLPVSS